jgi:Flp pilus assembly protein TadG
MRNHKEKGTILILGTVSMLLIVPMIGMAIDIGFLYAIKSKMQAAVDGAALAAARSLSDGATPSAQQLSAQNQGVTWFYANFPSTFLGVASVNMTTSDVTYSSANNIQTIAISASAQVNTFFMRWLGFTSTTVAANGTASRRDLVVMMVLDRSLSIAIEGECATMKSAAKAFTGQFAEGRDYIGLVTFSNDVLMEQAPTQSFQSALGYSNALGSGTGLIDNINCQGNTNTSQAISVAYNQLWLMNLPLAMNVLFLETDGFPNTLTLNFWDNTNTVSGLSSSSTCQDLNGKTKSAGGFGSLTSIVSGSNVVQWTPKIPLGTSSYLPSSSTVTSGGTVYAGQGIVGAVGSSDPVDGAEVFIYMQWPYYGSMMPAPGGDSASYFESNWAVAGTSGARQAYNCAWAASSSGPSTIPATANESTGPLTDFNWYPQTDVYGNYLNPSSSKCTGGTGSGSCAYASVTNYSDGIHVSANPGSTPSNCSAGTASYCNFRNAAENASDNAAYNARVGVAFPSPNASSTLQATIYVVGLGYGAAGSPAPDPILLQRIANDPNGDQINSTPLYAACSTESTCVNYPSQPQGEFIYSSNSADWGSAFLQIASQILRLSK